MSRVHRTRLGRPGGLPAVFAHCFLGHSGTWSRLIAALRTPLDAQAFDMPGHGRSGAWGGQGDLHAEVAALVGRFVADPALLIGHSFGGAAALRFALDRPERVTGLVLIEPVFFAVAAGEPEFAAHRAAEAMLHEAFATGDMQEAGRVFLALNGDADAWDALPEPQRAQIARQMPMVAASVAGVHADSGGLAAPGRLEAFDRPVLLLDGAVSPPTFGAVNRALARRLPRACRVTLPGAGHMLPITHGPEVADAIDRFLLDHGFARPGKPETRAG